MNLQGFCTADSPSWCEQLIHTGSSSASPVHPFSSSAHPCVWPDPWSPLLCPFCLAGAQAFYQSPFYALTWAKMFHIIIIIIIQTCGYDVINSDMCWDYTYFLRMGQSFMKWPILPQMRQQRSLGATSPSVRTSGSKKYSCNRWR